MYIYIYIYIYICNIHIYIYEHVFWDGWGFWVFSLEKIWHILFWVDQKRIHFFWNKLYIQTFFLVHSIFLGHWYPMFKYVGCYPASNNAASWAGYSDHKSDPGRPRGWPSARRSKVRSWDLGLSWHILAHLVTIWIYLIFLWKIWNR